MKYGVGVKEATAWVTSPGVFPVSLPFVTVSDFGLFSFQNHGVYMFRIDNDSVIDATIAGGPARYINHSCQVSKIYERRLFIYTPRCIQEKGASRSRLKDLKFIFLYF
jgi:hypothetical protein